MLNLNLNWVSETIKTLAQWWPVVKSNFQQIQNNYNSHISGTSDKHLAEHITYSGVVSGASNVKQGIDNIKNSYNGHINGDSDKHAAEHITFASNRLTLPDDNVKNAIETVDSRIEQIIQEQSLDPNKDVEVVSSRVSAIYGEFDTLPERLDNTDNIVNDLNAKIDAPDYSAPQEATASVITLPDDVVEGQFSVTLKGRSLKNELNYNRDTWAEWSKDDGVVGDSTGLKFTADGVNWLTAVLNNINIKPSTKYGLLYNVIDSTLVQPFMLGHPEHAFNTTILPASKGNQKVILTSQSSIFAQAFMLIVYNTEPAGNKIKLKDIRLFELPAGSEIEADFNTMSADQLAQKYPYIKGGSVVSTESVRAKAEGKNYLKDYDKNVSVNAYSLPGNLFDVPYVVPQNTDMTFKAYNCNIPNNTSIAIKSEDKSATLAAVSVGTGDKVITFNTGNNKIIWLRFYCGVNSPITYQYAQLENGTTATEWEEYKNGGEAYIDKVGGSLPNGVFDEKSVISGEGTQRTGKYVLQASDITNVGDGTINQYVMIKKPADFIGYGNVDINYGAFQLGNINNSSDWNWDSATSTNTVGAGYNENYFYYTPPLGTYTDLAAAQAALAGKSLIYQLATPIPHEGIAQPLTAFPGGHIIIEPVVRVTKPYNSGITVDRPIQAIESITKIEDGVRTPIDISKATVASDKLSLTITGASNNEIYEIIYQYPPELTTLPTIRYSYSMNTAAAIAENTKGVAANSKAINDFIAYQNAVNLQFDLRITALEP
ncbi:hypothetical protein V6C42_13025 [Pseudoclostridium thermosuccinogenes]|uniref:hypothetical protein n=1 Tax=Clostridium thermosuccinogenes TaxID=84032 RepID=UPI002FDAF46C